MTKAPLNPAALAEASAWLARLQNPSRDANADAAFVQWLAESADNEEAWGKVRLVWQQSATIRVMPIDETRVWPRLAAVLVATVMGLVAFLTTMTPSGDYAETAIGELKSLKTPDGTRVQLNTNTRLRYQISASSRAVDLKEGEAAFDVAKDPQRPFVVSAGAVRVTALGTVFAVRATGPDVNVTLSKGMVQVQDVASGRKAVLESGQTAVVSATDGIVVSSADLDSALAWQDGKLVFHATPLSAVVAEANRYSQVRLRVGSSAIMSRAVSGRFKAGDSVALANALCETLNLTMVRTGELITLMPK